MDVNESRQLLFVHQHAQTKKGERMSSKLIAALMSLCAMLLCGCANLVAPKYNPTFQTTQELRAKELRSIKVGTFLATSAPGANVEALSMRGAKFQSPYGGSFVTYLQEAVRQDLYDARLLDDAAPAQITGELIRNELNAAGVRTGDAAIEARFMVDEAGSRVFDKTMSVKHQWESSFAAANAVPLALEGYRATMQQLMSKLFGDPDFVNALKK